MADPVTIGALAASALAMAAEAALKGTIGEGVKDAYKALKEKISQWAGRDVEALAMTPSSAARQAVIAEVVNQLSAQEQEALKALVEKLVSSLKASDPAAGAAIGMLTQTIKSGSGSTNLQAGRDAIISR